MLRRTVADPSAELGAVEREYLAGIDGLLRDLPTHHRRELIAHAAEHLAERPPAEHTQELWKAVGSPSVYAAALRSIPPVARATRAERAASVLRRRSVRLSMAIVVIVGAATGFAWWRHVEPPRLESWCGGVDGDGYEVLRAAGEIEYAFGHEEGQRIGAHLCLRSDPDGARLLGTAYPDLGYPYLLLEPAGVRIRDSQGEMIGRFEAGELIDLPIDASNQLTVWFETTCAYRTGTDSFDWIPLAVRYQGRTFTVEVDLGYTISVTMDRDDCPELRG
jgi:hypothetical protein